MCVTATGGVLTQIGKPVLLKRGGCGGGRRLRRGCPQPPARPGPALLQSPRMPQDLFCPALALAVASQPSSRGCHCFCPTSLRVCPSLRDRIPFGEGRSGSLLSLQSHDLLVIREGQCTLPENSYSQFFLCSALFCFGDSLELYRVILRSDLIFTKRPDIHEAPREAEAISIFNFVLKGRGGCGGGRLPGAGGSEGAGTRRRRGRCRLRTLVGTAEAEARRSGRKGDSCCPAASCSFFVNVTREDVGFLYFSMI